MKKHINIYMLVSLLVASMLLVFITTGCSDNKNHLIIVEKGDSQQVSFAESIITNDEKSVRFIDENEREQYITGDYITITALKSKDEYLIIVKNDGMLNLVFPQKIISSSPTVVKYIDEAGAEKKVTGDITVIEIRDLK
jgi:hypothetical protein